MRKDETEGTRGKEEMNKRQMGRGDKNEINNYNGRITRPNPNEAGMANRIGEKI